VGLIAALVALSLAAGAHAGFSYVEDIEQTIRAANEYAKAIDDLIAKMEELPAEKTVEVFALIEAGELKAAAILIDELTAEQKIIDLKTAVETKELTEFVADWDSIADDKTVNLAASINAGDFSAIDTLLDGIPAEKVVRVDVDTEPAMEELSVFNATTGETVTIMVPIETTGAEAVQAEIDQLPTEKILEIKIQGEIATQIASITAQAKTAEAAFKYTAEVDIAKVNAAAETAKAAFAGISVSVDSLAESTSGMFGDLLGNWEKLSKLDQSQFTRAFERQEELEAAALASQIALNEAQVKNLEAQARAKDRGDATFTIDTSGLEPELDMIFWKIIEKAQIKGIEENPDFVL
jgi:hypothetical protein